MLCICYTQFLKSECDPCKTRIPGGSEFKGALVWHGIRTCRSDYRLGKFTVPLAANRMVDYGENTEWNT